MFMVTFAFIWQVFLLTESYLHSFFSVNISLQFLLVTFLKGFLFNYSGEFFSLFLKVPVNLAQYRVTMGIFQPIYFKFTLLGVFIFGYVMRSVQLSSTYSSLIFYVFLRFISIKGQCFENHSKLLRSVFFVPQHGCVRPGMSLLPFINIKWWCWNESRAFE